MPFSAAWAVIDCHFGIPFKAEASKEKGFARTPFGHSLGYVLSRVFSQTHIFPVTKNMTFINLV